jgi:hypothetical protein
MSQPYRPPRPVTGIACLEQGSASFVNINEELLERKSGGSALKSRDYGRRGSAALTAPQRLALTSPGSGGRSVGIVRSRTQTTEGSLLLLTRSIYVWEYEDYMSLRRLQVQNA